MGKGRKEDEGEGDKGKVKEKGERRSGHALFKKKTVF
jgi:hypothetical protein